MNKLRWLRILVIVEMILVSVEIAADFLLEGFLPEALRAYLKAEMDAPFRPLDILFLALAIPLCIAMIAAWIGLLRFWKHAPRLYLVATLGLVFSEALSGPSVMTSLGSALDSASSMLSGAIIGLLFFSEVRESYPHVRRSA